MDAHADYLQRMTAEFERLHADGAEARATACVRGQQAYHTAVLKGTEVDQPRNLAKLVTVE